MSLTIRLFTSSYLSERIMESGLNNRIMDPRLDGVEAVVLPGYRFYDSDCCNLCTVEILRGLFGEEDVKFFASPLDNGVNVVCEGSPVVWFPDVPTRCTCNLEETKHNDN